MSGRVLIEVMSVWEKAGGIQKEQFDKAKNRGTLYQIINHRLYRQNECMFPFRSVISSSKE